MQALLVRVRVSTTAAVCACMWQCVCMHDYLFSSSVHFVTQFLRNVLFLAQC
jgi:hypothetical protein